MKVLFEPWSLGDALIAASVLRSRPGEYALACNSRWHELIKATISDPVMLIDVDLNYTLKKSKKHNKSFRKELKEIQPRTEKVSHVFSIRGDIRDYLVSKALFPLAKNKTTGWYSFFARRFRILDLPFQTRTLKTVNRYERWFHLLGISFQEYSASMSKRQIDPDKRLEKKRPISIHLGAQWKSKQYPHVQSLRNLISKKSSAIQLLAAPGDFLPPGLNEGDVSRLLGLDLVKKLQESRLVITNDSGPMHLAAALDVPTFSIGSSSNIYEWLPPGVKCMTSKDMPNGYWVNSSYATDDTQRSWPKADEVISYIEKLNLL
jgi:ADP-heptose:LPS heptosyltransferase